MQDNYIPTQSDLNRFWSKVSVGAPDECWEWTGCRHTKGYGDFSAGGKHIRAHRFSWIIANGEISTGLSVLHRCDNPPCINPSHLFLGTVRENILDMIHKGRANKPNRRGIKIERWKVRDWEVPLIRELKNHGISGAGISRIFDISGSHACAIIRGDKRRILNGGLR